MSDNIDSLILEQLKAIRADLGQVKSDMEDLKTSQKSVEGMIFGLAGYMRDIDQRVEHIEEKLGA